MFTTFETMEGYINISGVIGENYNLKDLIVDVEKNKDADVLNFIIDSVGGYVDDGFAMARYIEQLDQKTVSHGKMVYSIANIVFFACDERRPYAKESEQGEFMLHNAWVGWASGSKDELRDIADDLERVDAQIRNFISLKTGLDDSVLTALMSKDTYVSNDEAEALGFFNKSRMLSFAAMSKPNDLNDFKTRVKNMSNTNALKDAYKALKKVLNMPDDEPVNVDLTLSDGSQISVDAETGESIEGAATNAPNGQHTLEDGRVITVSDGVITSVESASEEQAEDKDAKIAELEAKIVELSASLTDQYEKEEEKMAKAVQNALNPIQEELQEFKQREEEVIKMAKAITSHYEKFPDHPNLNQQDKINRVEQEAGSFEAKGRELMRKIQNKNKLK